MNGRIRKWLVVGAAGTGAFGLAYGAAAGLNVTGTDLSAAAGAVSACTSDGIDLSYTTSYDATDGRYEVTAVVAEFTAAGNDACDGKTLAVTLADGDGESIGNGSAAIDAADADDNYALVIAAAPPASDVEKIAVSIG